MSSILDRLKKTRGQGREALQKSLESRGQGGFKRDERIWKYAFKEVKGKQLSISKIRFLTTPLVDLEAQDKGDIPADAVLSPCALQIRHYFAGPGGNYSEISPQTWGEECPVREYDRSLWEQQKATDDKALKEVLKERLPKKDYYANILVIQDDANPENEGKVMLFKFSEGIKKVIDKASNPDFPTDPVIADPFCMYEGAVLSLEMVGSKRKWKGRDVITPDFQNSKMTWGESGPLHDGDEEKIAETWKQCYSLYEFLKPSLMKDFDTLADRLRKVMGLPDGAPLIGAGKGFEAAVGKAPGQGDDKPVKAQDLANEAGNQKENTPSGTATDGGVGGDSDSDDGTSGDIDDFERLMQEAEEG